jgi:predicted short-subunit dehydrogenase-like oxidoreductase (DUF2520 family)
VEFVGRGRPVAGYDELERADLVMISASDEALQTCAGQVAESGILDPAVVVFHVSGSLPSSLLGAAKSHGALVASVHPVKSFADPARAVDSFAGTFCAVEGDGPACDVLRDALGQCGARTFQVDPRQKTIYHAATVLASNYLVALMEVGLRCFDKAGVSRQTALEVMEPIVRGTVENVFELGPVRALTGPIARGEPSVVARQAEALGQWDELVEALYKRLGQVAVDLASAQKNAAPDALAVMRKMLAE